MNKYTWSRIFSNGDEIEPNEKSLQFYEKVFEKCRKNNLEVLITMSHFEKPLNLVTKYEGWKNIN